MSLIWRSFWIGKDGNLDKGGGKSSLLEIKEIKNQILDCVLSK